MTTTDILQVRLSKQFELTPQVSKLLTLLLVMETVSAECIASRIGKTQPGLLIFKIRRAFEAHGLRHKIRNARGYGYYLDDAARIAILDLPCLAVPDPSCIVGRLALWHPT